MNATSTISNFIGSHSLIWVPIVIFVVILLISGLVGFINGWKTSLYFFGWNVVALITGVFVSSPVVNSLDGAPIIGKLLNSLQDIAGPLIILFIMILANLLAFAFYWFFQRKLKKSMLLNKKAGKSNLSSRFIGLGIAVSSAMPMAAFAASSVGIVSEDNTFTQGMDTLTKGFTGGKFQGAKNSRTAIKGVSHLADLIIDMVGNSGNVNLGSPEAIGTITEMLNSDAVGTVSDIYDAAGSIPLIKEKLDQALNVDTSTISNFATHNPLGIEIGKGKVQGVKDTIMKIFKDQDKADAIYAYLTNKPNPTNP